MTQSDLRFQRCHRLLSTAEFQPLFDQPDFRVGGANLLILARRQDQPFPRLGLVVAKRRIRHAVQRNLVKRLCRESFRQRRAELTGLDLVILVKATLPRPDARVLRAELERLWDKLLAKSGQA